jgi:hypothetical protein
MFSSFTKVLILFVCLHVFSLLLVGYIYRILGVGGFWDQHSNVLINNASLKKPCKFQIPLVFISSQSGTLDLAFGSQQHVAQLVRSYVPFGFCPSSSISTLLVILKMWM